MAGGRTLVVLGSGPGIGVSIASPWVKHGFEKVALLARDSVRLENDSKSVSEAAGAAGKAVEVKTWSVDVNNSKALKIVLTEVQLFGQIDCALFNAAAELLDEIRAIKVLLQDLVKLQSRDNKSAKLADDHGYQDTIINDEFQEPQLSRPRSNNDKNDRKLLSTTT